MISEKWAKWTCHFKENNLYSHFSNDNIWDFQQKSEVWKTWIHHCELDGFQDLDSPHQIGSAINKSDM